MTDTAWGRLRRLVAFVPGARVAREVLVGSVGSWLYHGSTLAWLSDPGLVRQLPRSYRVFARYCAAQGVDPIGAELLLRGVIALSRLQREVSGTVALRVAEMTICLDLRDPRFLRVPGELIDARAVLRCWLRPGDTFVDAGANHGSFSVAA